MTYRPAQRQIVDAHFEKRFNVLEMLQHAFILVASEVVQAQVRSHLFRESGQESFHHTPDGKHLVTNSILKFFLQKKETNECKKEI